MEIAEIKAFLAVADQGGFRAAAEHLQLSQPAVSRAVARLEDKLGVTLLNRIQGRAAVLTPAGCYFASRARGALRELQQGASNLSVLARGTSGHLRVLLTGHLTCGGRTLFESFKNMNPDVIITFKQIAPAKARSSLEKGRADLYFSAAPLVSASLENCSLWRERLMLVVSAHHRCAKLKSLPTADLRDETLIIVGRRGQDYSGVIARQFGFSITHISRPATFEDTLNEISFGYGAIIAPCCNVEILPPGLVAIPLTGRGSVIRRVIAWLPDTENPLMGRFLAHVRKLAAQGELSRMRNGHAPPALRL